jgi:hypothetical protein
MKDWQVILIIIATIFGTLIGDKLLHELSQPTPAPPPFSITIGWNIQSRINGEPVDDRELQRAVNVNPDGVIGKNTIEAVLFQNSLDDRFWEKSHE